MEYKRTFLYAALFAVAYSLWMSWLNDHPHQSAENATSVATAHEQPALKKDAYIPNVVTAKKQSPTAQSEKIATKSDDSASQVRVKTDVLDVMIDTTHGDVIDTKLLNYQQSPQEKDKPFHLLYSGDNAYVANNSLFVKNDGNIKNLNLKFTSDKASYQLKPHQDELVVTLTGQSGDIEVSKTFTFKRDSYLVDVKYDIKNSGDTAWQGYMNSQLLRHAPDSQSSGLFHVSSYTGAAFSDPSNKLYQKLSFSDMGKENLSKKVKNGWIAMQQHYFLTAWVPPVGEDNHFYSRVIDGQYLIGFVSSVMEIKPQESHQVANRLYIGPELTGVLSKIAPGLDLTIDYGWLWFISKYLFLLMSYIHSIVGNWGWSIVLVTMCIKLLFFQLSAKSYRSMANMRNLQPKIEALRKRHGDDKAKLSQATMELYRKEKVNPFGGCLPIIVQIPVFIALYWVLLESVQLRQAPWILWIHDLSIADPYYILPVVMGLTMLLQQKLSPASPDPDQAKMMMMLPVVFTFLFASFPAGLVLYWTVNNGLSILQQWYITNKYSGEKKNKKITLNKAAV